MADEQQFKIADELYKQYPRLIELIKATESMTSEEKQYWFSILPIMTTDQVEKLQNILETERQKLDELNKKYEQQMNNLNDKHLLEWQTFMHQENVQKRQRREAVENKNKQAEESALLEELQNL